MTEYEMAYLSAELQTAAITTFSVLVTVVSGFLVVGYAVSHRLNRQMIAIIMVMYTWYMWLATASLSRQLVSQIGLTQKMQAFAHAGKGLEWHAANLMPYSANPGTAFAASLAFGAVMHIGSVLFFFAARQANLEREAADA